MLVSSRNMNHRGFVVNERRARLEYRNTNGKHLDHAPRMTKAPGSSLFDVGATLKASRAMMTPNVSGVWLDANDHPF